MRAFFKTALLFAAVAATSCIKPLELIPDIEGAITAFEVEGQTRPATINAATRTVGVEVGGDVDLSAVRVTRIEFVETASSSDIGAGSVLDLSSPLRVTVTTAASYQWTIAATKLDNATRRPLPGGDFDEWHTVNMRGEVDPSGTVWNPWAQGAVWEQERWWDTGNSGAAISGGSNSTPTEPGEGCPANPGGRAARLLSIWAMIKAAGGNIYFGRFGEFTGINATCDIGHPWQTKPRALKGWYKYFPQPVDQALPSYVAIHPYKLTRAEWMGSMDSLHINIALWASPDGRNIPFTVNTDTNAFVDFQRDTPGVIAYGSFVSGREQADWAEFDLPLEYFNDGPLPENTQLFLQITSSKNCNYFIAGTSGGGPDGKTGSLMYVDELELVYD